MPIGSRNEADHVQRVFVVPVEEVGPEVHALPRLCIAMEIEIPAA